MAYWWIYGCFVAVLLGVMYSAMLTPAVAAAKKVSPEEVATHVRLKGLPCGKALKARRITSRYNPAATVWLLKCDNANYRITLIPGETASVMRMGGYN